jgi:Hypervirulence associated proteins TUDOR domain
MHVLKPTIGNRVREMAHQFKVGDHVSWNSEGGRVRGTIKKIVTRPMRFKSYMVHASREQPQYLIKSDKTDHLAMHKGTALKKIARKYGASKNRSAPRKRKSSPLISGDIVRFHVGGGYRGMRCDDR